MAIVTDLLIKGSRSSAFQREQQEAIDEARDAMAEMTKEIRGAISSEKGDYAIDTAEGDNFIFYNDVDQDGIKEKIRIYRDNTELKKVITEPGSDNLYSGTGLTSVVARYMNNGGEPVFEYADQNMTPAVTNNQIRLVTITLKINVTPEVAPADYFLEGSVKLRNTPNGN